MKTVWIPPIAGVQYFEIPNSPFQKLQKPTREELIENRDTPAAERLCWLLGSSASYF